MYLAAPAHNPPPKGHTLRGRGGEGVPPSIETNNVPNKRRQVTTHAVEQRLARLGYGATSLVEVFVVVPDRASAQHDILAGHSAPSTKHRLVNSEPAASVMVNSGDGEQVGHRFSVRGREGLFPLALIM